MSIFCNEHSIESYQNRQLQQAINEAYFGRNAGITKVYNAYCDWREPLISKSKYFTATIKNVYNEDMKYFRKCVCEQFGFETFSYTVVQSATINSFTITEFIPTRNKNKLEITKNGYKFKDGSNVNAIVAVYSDLVFNPYYTNEENFAIFLHEIGHNFQTAVNKTVFSLTAATGLFYVLIDLMRYGPIEPIANLLVSSDNTKKVINNALNDLLDNKAMQCIYTVTSMLLYMGTSIKNIVLDIIQITGRPVVLIVGALYNLLPFLLELITGSHLKSYYGERFADGFAASYGFGEALASALKKFDGMNYARSQLMSDDIMRTPIIGHLYVLACMPGLMLWSIIDCHPSTEDRCKSIIKDLRYDLNDPSTPPALKKQLEKEIDDYEAAMSEYFKESKKFYKPSAVPAVMQELIYNKLGGSAKLKMSELPYMMKGGFRSSNYNNNQELKEGYNFISNTEIV